jgi:gliding motility-associated-like protein
MKTIIHFRNSISRLGAIVFISFLSHFSTAQCNTNNSICTPGVAGPFNFVTPGPNVSTCLDFYGDIGYIILHITSSGPLNILINGNANSGYLDVAIFNIPNGETPCSAIQNNANQIGCNYASSSSGCNQFGTQFPCASSVAAPNVSAGQELMIVVDNWSNTSSTFTLELASTGAQTGPPNGTITPVGPFCSNASAVQLNAVDMGGTWSGPGTSSTGLFTPSSAGVGTHTINYTIGSAPCNASGTTTISVGATPTANSMSNITACANATVTVPAFSSTTSGTTYSWTNSNTAIGLAASGTGDISSFTGTNSGSSAITSTVTVTPSNNGCTGTPITFTITVNPSPTMNQPANTSYCHGATALSSSFSSSVGGVSYAWTNNNTTIGLTSSGSGNTPSFTTNNTNSTAEIATISVIPTANTCSGNTYTYTITINASPSVNTITDETDCEGNTIPAKYFTSTPSGANYTWTNSNPAIGLAESGVDNTPAFVAQASSSGVTTTATVDVTANLSGCTGSSRSFTITISPLPTVSPITSVSQCSGSAISDINFSGTPTSVTFEWTNDNTSSGLTASGTGNISSFIPVNSTGSDIVSSIIVTPTIGTCTGAPENFTITIAPTPTISQVNDLFYCPSETAPASSFSVVPSGASITWTNSNTNIGLAANGSGNVPSFTTANSGATDIGQIDVTPSLGACIGEIMSYNIQVSQAPTMTDPIDIVVCAGDLINASNFTSTTSGTNYSWTNDNSAIGLASSGSGNYTSFTATNTSSNPITSTIEVTPGIGSCTGTAESFTITVNPKPVMTAISNQTLCNQAMTTNINFSSSPSGSNFAWTNNNTSIGLGASGSGDIASFAALNSGSTMTTAVIAVTPTLNGCIGTSENFQFQVNPTPSIAAKNDIIQCSETTISVGAATTTPSTGVSITWTNSNTAIGLGANGSGTISNFTAANNGNSQITASIVLTPTYATCVGNPMSFNIAVNPTGTIQPLSNITACMGDLIDIPDFIGNDPATTFTWTNTNTNIGIGINGSGNISDFTAANPSGTTELASLQVTPSYNGCIGAPAPFNITVKPIPTISSINDIEACANTNVTVSAFTSTPSGSSYAWTNSETAVGLASNGTGNIANFTGTNTTNLPLIASISVSPTLNGCSGSPENFTITIEPELNPSIIQNGPLCEGDTLFLEGVIDVPVEFIWTGPNQFSSIEQDPNEPHIPLEGDGTYFLTVVSGNCSATVSEAVIVNPGNSPTVSSAGPFCNNNAAIQLFADLPGGTWSGNGITNTSTGQFDPSVANAGDHIITYATSGACSGSSSITISVNALPVPDFTADTQIGCAPHTVTFTNTSSPLSDAVQWNFGDQTSASSVGSVSHIYTTPGIYSVSLTATTAGCSGSITKNQYIEIQAAPIASFYTNETEAPASDPIFMFNNTSSNANYFDWDFGDGYVDTVESPAHIFPNIEGNYTVTLIVSNSIGCTDYTSLGVTIKEELLYFIPNSFTPDGDEFNHTFKPVFTTGIDPYTFSIQVYNRWGELIFEGHDLKYGWDGTYMGNKVETGTYVWKITFREAKNDARHQITGTLNLLR